MYLKQTNKYDIQIKNNLTENYIQLMIGETIRYYPIYCEIISNLASGGILLDVGAKERGLRLIYSRKFVGLDISV